MIQTQPGLAAPWFRPWADSTIVAAMGSRILVADDEPHIREVVRAYLEREGYDVVEAADGETALEQSRSMPLDLLILRDTAVGTGVRLSVAHVAVGRDSLRVAEVVVVGLDAFAADAGDGACRARRQGLDRGGTP